MSLALTIDPYHPPSPADRYSYRSTGVSTPSPPMDDGRCSLPSISDLFNSADIGSSSNIEQGACLWRSDTAVGMSLIADLHRHVAERQQPRSGRTRSITDSLPAQSQQSSHHHGGGKGLAGVIPPPSPPLCHAHDFDDHQSPSTGSQHSSPPAHHPHLSPYQASASASATATGSRQAMMPSSVPYGVSSGQLLPPSYGPGSDALGRPPDWYHARAPGQHFPPPAGLSTGVPGPSGTSPWQHHHHISPSSQLTFPPSQDRYICQTCSKAFSRPSSLRIHSHSHTGEKPFKCPHDGCGKAFSVRSNMKRHERGCHAGSPSAM
ncbi:MAG: hypothetical protein M1815_004833 [Lichina confinis]|nr:MAG: hypothetical protein M1815_004833 [Lichina confinis]